ncbi:MAG: bifunctional UDP-N-acetylglucosamine diphosphorylase/glucosamine-1-phosphate N-acetyltransferase GlmU [Bacillota bacterium]|nr:bifunctional UDP-N-acetylglucosamine diphosphorylase/glucosamine-1-phosphate N-acetyltransferase GlmU [Bacillota bacterium]
MNSMTAVILAAGRGTRMKSDIPKVLHNAAGMPLIKHVLAAVEAAGIDDICMVVGHGAEQVKACCGERYAYAVQQPQLGTGHAVQQALPYLTPGRDVLVLCGDTPLLDAATLGALRAQFAAAGADCTVLTARPADAAAYGRIVRGADGDIAAIVEYRDADDSLRAIGEVNSGVYCFRYAALTAVIDELKADNAQGELYLTDAVAAIKARGGRVSACVCADAEQIAGVNDRVQLAEAGKALWRRKARQLMADGVSILDPDSVYIDAGVSIGADTLIEPQAYIYGDTVIGSGCHIGPAVKIIDSVIGDGCDIGPFAYLRPGTRLGDKVKAGHFVEMKNAQIGNGSKVPHLSYIGDAVIGERSNIGCGTITCNYDGVHKHTTTIGDEVFVGSNSNFIAPVTVGDRASIAAGSTVTEDVPAGALAVARGRQYNSKDWARRKDPRYNKDK